MNRRLHGPLVATLLAAAGLVAVAPGAAGSPGRGGDGSTPGSLGALGERIYRQGIGRSGRAVRGSIAGGATLDGTIVTCVSCHRRSGLGSIEGAVVATPVTGTELFRALPRRPAYTDASLARALREGIDPSGRRLGSAMPRYDFDDRELAALVRYLRDLSAEPSPGVTERDLHLATVYSDDVDPIPMLALLESWFADRNVESRQPTRRRDHGPWYRDNRNLPYRKWVLHRWRLEGDPRTWRRQLERYYAEQPVFALVSGSSRRDWTPVHEFCERHGIPSLLPNIDAPPIDDDGFYNLYFSRGVSGEAATLADALARDGAPPTILQAFTDDPEARTAARAFRREWTSRTGHAPAELVLGERVDLMQLVDELDRVGAQALALWVAAPRLRSPAWQVGLPTPVPVYLSASLLDEAASTLPEGWRRGAWVVRPFTLPGELEKRFARIEAWLIKHDIPTDQRRTLGQTWFACMVLAEGLMHVRYDNYFRDYLLESIDHATGKIVPYSTHYPRPSFGPGQRYLSKGAYLVRLDATETPRWVVPR